MNARAHLVVLCSLLLVTTGAYADPAGVAPRDLRADDVLYVELLGSGGGASLNYERIFVPNLALRVGVSFYVKTWPSGSLGVYYAGKHGTPESAGSYALGFPLLVEWFGVGSERHHLEFGAGLVAIVDVPPVVGALVVGYRSQRSEGGFIFRAGFTPLLGRKDYAFLPLSGVSLGGAF